MNNYFYSEHQQYLYDTIKELHRKGLGYRKISNWFNERDIKTRGSDFKGNYKDDKKEGLWKWYHENGQLSDEGNFKDGELISQKCWDEK